VPSSGSQTFAADVAEEPDEPDEPDEPENAEEAEASAVKTSFSCDGRTTCSEMTSCAEAEYFLEHCPGVEMDGNNDGEPCEMQWCGNHRQ